jgi:hypothetical protein
MYVSITGNYIDLSDEGYIFQGPHALVIWLHTLVIGWHALVIWLHTLVIGWHAIVIWLRGTPAEIPS